MMIAVVVIDEPACGEFEQNDGEGFCGDTLQELEGEFA